MLSIAEIGSVSIFNTLWSFLNNLASPDSSSRIESDSYDTDSLSSFGSKEETVSAVMVNIREVFLTTSVFWRLVFPVVLFFLLFASHSHAGQATLMWDPPEISTDVTGYVVDYGTASGTYTQGVNVGNITSYTLGNLSDGQTYYFAVAAYNSAGAESEYSNEVSKTMDIPNSLLTIKKTGTGSGVVTGNGINCGSICSASYTTGTIVSLSAKADTGSTFVGLSGGGCNGIGLCVITMNYATTITAIFNTNIANYLIVATVNGSGGSISPSGTLSVSPNGSKTFTITPRRGYRIAGVTVDGRSVGSIYSYTFTNVTANHTISASFRRS